MVQGTGRRKRAGHNPSLVWGVSRLPPALALAVRLAVALPLSLETWEAAQAAPDPVAASTASGPGGAFNFLDGISRSGAMLGDLWGLRPLLGRAGVTLTLQETSELLGNVSGGTRRGFDYDGLTTATLQMDTQRAFGLHGGTINISALQSHGRNLSSDNLGSLQTASGIEADRSTRLWEAWVQQKFLQDDQFDIRNIWSVRPLLFSSIPCLAGPCCPRPICPAVVLPILCPRQGCGCANMLPSL